MKINVAYRVEGFYQLTVRKVATDEVVRELGPFKNAITDIGLERMGANGTLNQYAYVGTGTTPAATTDTQMGVYLRNTTSSFGAVTTRASGSPYWVQQSLTYRFNPSGVNSNITEVGIGWVANSTSGLWSRALTVDGSNNPITVTVLLDEYLDVTYTLRYYPPLTDSAYNVVISGTNYSFVTRLSQAATSPIANISGIMFLANIQPTVYGGPCALGPVTGQLTGTVGSASIAAATAQTYVAASKTMKYQSSNALNIGNVAGGITGIAGNLSGTAVVGCAFQTTISPAIPKDATKTLSLMFAITWDRN